MTASVPVAIVVAALAALLSALPLNIYIIYIFLVLQKRVLVAPLLPCEHIAPTVPGGT